MLIKKLVQKHEKAVILLSGIVIISSVLFVGQMVGDLNQDRKNYEIEYTMDAESNFGIDIQIQNDKLIVKNTGDNVERVLVGGREIAGKREVTNIRGGNEIIVVSYGKKYKIGKIIIQRR